MNVLPLEKKIQVLSALVEGTAIRASKKIENLEYAVSLHSMYYNFYGPHKTLNPRAVDVTPAMAAEVTNRR